MLYLGFSILPRSVFWSANLNGRSDNLDVIPLVKREVAVEIHDSITTPCDNCSRSPDCGRDGIWHRNSGRRWRRPNSSATSIPGDIQNIEFAAIHSSQRTEQVAKAFSTGDRIDLYQFLDPTQLRTTKPNGAEGETSIRQQWSLTEMGLTKRRPHYTQSYRHLVLSLTSTDGGSKQYTISLPEYGEMVKIDLSRNK